MKSSPLILAHALMALAVGSEEDGFDPMNGLFPPVIDDREFQAEAERSAQKLADAKAKRERRQLRNLKNLKVG